MGGIKQVVTACHMGDVLELIIHHDRKVVGDSDVLSGENRVSVFSRIYLCDSETEILEEQVAVEFRCFA